MSIDKNFGQKTIEAPKKISPEEEKRNLIERLKRSPELEWYKHQKVNLDVLDGFLDDFDSQTEARQEETGVKKARRSLTALVHSIKQSVVYYSKQVNAQDRLQKREFRMEEFEYKEKMIYRDRARHIEHEALVSNITSLTRFININLPKLGVKILLHDNWFTSEQVTDRYYLGEWAIKIANAEIILEEIRSAEFHDVYNKPIAKSKRKKRQPLERRSSRKIA